MPGRWRNTTISAKSTARSRPTNRGRKRASWAADGAAVRFTTSLRQAAPAQIVDMFERDPSLGIVGPAALRMPNARYTADMAWGTDKNRELTMRLARRMGVHRGEPDLDFFAGTMFWVRPRALEPIRRLNLQRSDFPDEAGQLDGELQHAFERLFSVSAMRRGYLFPM